MIKPLAQKLIDSIREDFGNPMGLKRLIEKAPYLRARIDDVPDVIAASSVVRWHEWSSYSTDQWPRGSTGRLIGWKMYGGQYASDSVDIPALKSLCIRTQQDDFECDIKQVTGIAASKSELYTFATIEDMAIQNCSYLIQDVSPHNLKKNLDWPEVRIVNEKSSDFFTKYGWDSGMYLMNSGGSHHFAAAHYISAQLNIDTALRGRLVTIEMNAQSIAELNNEYSIYAISDELHASLDFHKAMQDFKAEYYWQKLPQPYDESRAIFLPRNQARSVKVADVLRDSGFTDIGAVLSELASPYASEIRSERQAQMRLRVAALPGLLETAGAAYVFSLRASEAMADSPAALINWQAVERATIIECIYEHGQDAGEVFSALAKHSPAITSPQAIKALSATVEGYSALHRRTALEQGGEAPAPN